MKIIFTSSYKTYFKDNTKNYVTNYYILVFLISVIFFSSSYNMGHREYSFIYIWVLDGFSYSHQEYLRGQWFNQIQFQSRSTEYLCSN